MSRRPLLRDVPTPSDRPSLRHTARPMTRSFLHYLSPHRTLRQSREACSRCSASQTTPPRSMPRKIRNWNGNFIGEMEKSGKRMRRDFLVSCRIRFQKCAAVCHRDLLRPAKALLRTKRILDKARNCFAYSFYPFGNAVHKTCARPAESSWQCRTGNQPGGMKI